MSRARDIANYGDGIDTSSITSGTFADARIAQSNVTQHESAIDALGTVASGTFNGTIGDNADFPAGHVLQVIQTVKTDSFSTSGSLADVTGMSVNITPSSVSNKIFVMLGINFGGDTNVYGRGSVLRNTTVISTSTALSLSSQTNATLALNGNSNDFQYKMKHAVFNYLDSPSSTSSLTYKLQLGTHTSTQYIYLNRPLYNTNDTWIVGGVSSITVMEIAG